MPPRAPQSHISNFMPNVTRRSSYPASLPPGLRLTRNKGKRNIRRHIRVSNNINRRNYNRRNAPGVLNTTKRLNINQVRYLMSLKPFQKTVKNVRHHDPFGNYRANKIAKLLTKIRRNQSGLNETLNDNEENNNLNYSDNAIDASRNSNIESEASTIFANIHSKLSNNLETENNIKRTFMHQLSDYNLPDALERRIVKKLYEMYPN
jgi:hypothetical protein